MKKMYAAALFLLLAGLLFGGKVATFPELLKPGTITVSGDECFITDGVKIYIYSLKDYKLKSQFGKKGEGPQEFRVDMARLTIEVQPGFILVNSEGKVSYFSRKGTFSKEFKVGAFAHWFKPVGKQFVGHSYRKDGKISYYTINTYDPDFKKIKEIYKVENIVQKGKTFVLTRTLLFDSYKDWVLIYGKTGDMVIDIFDADGEFSHSIKQEYQPVKVTKDHQEEVFTFYKTHPVFKNLFEMIKKELVFPKYLPAVRSFIAVDGKIYVQTYKKKDGKGEFYVFDMKGKLLKTVMVPFSFNNIMLEDLYTVSSGKLYQLVENEETEKWDLHIIPIE